MVDDCGNLSCVVLEERQLGTIDLEEEIRFRFGINIECTLQRVLAKGLPNQPISFLPDPHFRPGGKRRAWCKFVVADGGIKKFCAQLDSRRLLGQRRR